MNTRINTTRRRSAWGATALALGLTVGLSGCDSLLEVSNPNNVAGDDILNPAAATAMANGALSGVARAYSNALTSYSTITDELDWIGSRDAYQQHEFGNMDDPFNEFTDVEFPQLARGHWMAREAVRILAQHDADGVLEDRTDLARSQIYLAIADATAGDTYDDFVISDRATDAPPVGEANMNSLYNDAITQLTSAIAIAQAEGDADLELLATALRASVHHRLAIWNLVGTQPISMGLASSAAAGTDAAAAIAMGAADWDFQFAYSSSTVGSRLGAWVNDRQEMEIGKAFADADANPTLTDLIDVATVMPGLAATIDAFDAGSNNPSARVIGMREMHLIIAENALAAGDNAGFDTAINNLRALDGLTAFSGQPGVTRQDLLIHHRRSDLYLQGRRLADLYRFGLTVAEWQGNSTAVTAPGTFLPISVIECRANPQINDTC